MLLTLFVCSCSMGTYVPRNVNNFGVQTNVVLDRANYRIVSNVEVVIDINNDNLKRVDVEKSAYAALLRRANLTGSQALINVVVEEVRRESMNIFRVLFSGIPHVVQHVAARATIIEFLDDSGNPIPSLPNQNQGTAPRIETSVDEHKQSYSDAENASTISELKQPIIQIYDKWKTFTKDLAETINRGEQIDPIYDLNEDGIITIEELNEIDKIYKVAILSSNYQSDMEKKLISKHNKYK